MAAYLVEHPPARSQYRHPRRAKPTGCVVLHSAENVPDLNPPDTGADSVAKFIVGRSDPGSYHVICDSDSAIHLVDFADEAFQDGTGSNPWAIAISGAFRAAQWPTLPADWRAGVVEQMAQAAVRAALWLKDIHGVTVPAVHLDRAESDAGRPGFITHALRDPARRSDPGGECASLVVARYAQLISGAPEPPEEETVQLIYVQKQGADEVYLASVKTAPRHVKLFRDAEFHAGLSGDVVRPLPADTPSTYMHPGDGEGQKRRVLLVADGTLYGI
jgi:hypothetical protein